MFFQDNDSKHTSRSTKAWMEQAGIINSVMKTPASSRDLNPIENVWGWYEDFLAVYRKTENQRRTCFWHSLLLENFDSKAVCQIHRPCASCDTTGYHEQWWSDKPMCVACFLWDQFLNFLITSLLWSGILSNNYSVVLYLNRLM